MRNLQRCRILVVIDAYEPGFRHGGPIRSVRNMVDALGADFDFRILTLNRDSGSATPYGDIEPDTWISRDHGHTYYSSAHRISARLIGKLARSEGADLVYLNSLFSASSRSYLCLARTKTTGPPVLLAPRGELDIGAIGYHAGRKRMFLTASRTVRLFNGIVWHATNETERLRISALINSRADVLEAPNIPRPPDRTLPKPHAKVSGSVRLLFLARVSPKKNLPFLLEILSCLTGHIHLTVAGPHDPGYLSNLPALISQLPSNVHVDIAGALNPRQVDEAILTHHALVLPTLAENFGHSIWESIRMGRPVFISDQTPWKRSRDAEFGCVIPLSDRDAWIEQLDRLTALNQHEYEQLAASTFRFAQDWQRESVAANLHALMFRSAIRGSG